MGESARQDRGMEGMGKEREGGLGLGHQLDEQEGAGACPLALSLPCEPLGDGSEASAQSEPWKHSTFVRRQSGQLDGGRCTTEFCRNGVSRNLSPLGLGVKHHVRGEDGLDSLLWVCLPQPEVTPEQTHGGGSSLIVRPSKPPPPQHTHIKQY